MIWLLLPVAFLLGALGRRIAGGVLNQWFRPGGGRVFGDTPARLIFGLTIAIAALAGGWPLVPAACLIVAVWIGTTFGNHSSIDLGRGEGTFWRDYGVLTVHGLVGVALPVLAAILADQAWWWLVVAGLAIGPAYALGWSISGLYGLSRLPAGLRGGTEIGEALWGGAMGAGAFLAGVLA